MNPIMLDLAIDLLGNLVSKPEAVEESPENSPFAAEIMEIDTKLAEQNALQTQHNFGQGQYNKDDTNGPQDDTPIFWSVNRESQHQSQQMDLDNPEQNTNSTSLAPQTESAYAKDMDVDAEDNQQFFVAPPNNKTISTQKEITQTSVSFPKDHVQPSHMTPELIDQMISSNPELYGKENKKQVNMADAPKSDNSTPIQVTESRNTTLLPQAALQPLLIDKSATPALKEMPNINYAFTHQTNPLGDQHLKIHLVPADLGHIRVDLKTDGLTGDKSVSMIFSQSSTYDLFKDNTLSLQQMLSRAGYDITAENINLHYPGDDMRENLENFFARHQQHQSSSKNFLTGEEIDEEEVTPLMQLNHLLSVNA